MRARVSELGFNSLMLLAGAAAGSVGRRRKGTAVIVRINATGAEYARGERAGIPPQTPIRKARRRRWCGALASALIGFVVGTPVAHAYFACTGPITYLAINNAGHLYIQLNFGVWSICNLRDSYTNGGSTVYPETCRAWYAGLLASQKVWHSATLYFPSEGNPSTNGPECAAIGNWVSPNPLPYHLDVNGS